MQHQCIREDLEWLTRRREIRHRPESLRAISARPLLWRVSQVIRQSARNQAARLASALDVDSGILRA